MKVLFDHQIFSWQKYGGISRYFTEIISNLPDDVNSEVSIKYSDNEYLIKSEIKDNLDKLFLPINHFYPNIKFPFKRKLFKYIYQRNPERYPDSELLNKKSSIELLKKQDFDIFHPTYFDDYFLDYLNGKPFVLTIHDMIHEIYPEMFNNDLTSRNKKKLALNASHIIAVSENTKKDIIDILQISPDKISVVYHGNSLKENELHEININIPRKYLLFVGERKNYKNFLFFARSVENILKRNFDLCVVCVGHVFDKNEMDFLSDLGILSQFKTISCNDIELQFLYKHAIALIYPSYYEGFGIPIIEAFNNACPVVLSKSSCFPEIAQNGGIYFNPKSNIELENSIIDILNNNSLRSKLIENGMKISKSFLWEYSALKTFDVYKTVLI